MNKKENVLCTKFIETNNKIYGNCCYVMLLYYMIRHAETCVEKL